jgi:hypothetical protein
VIDDMFNCIQDCHHCALRELLFRLCLVPVNPVSLPYVGVVLGFVACLFGNKEEII